MQPDIATEPARRPRPKPNGAASAPDPSPERQRLAAAVEQHSALSDRLARLQTAHRAAEQACYDAARAVDTAEGVLDEARKDQPKRYVAKLLGEAADDADLTAAAERALDQAQRQLVLAREGRAMLAEEIGAAQSRVQWARMDLDRAIQDFVASSPEVERLLADYEATLQRLVAMRMAIMEIGESRLPKSAQAWDVRVGVVEASVEFWIRQDTALCDAWRIALDRLATDADAKLPE